MRASMWMDEGRHYESFEHRCCNWLNHTTWFHGNCRTHSTEILESISPQRCPEAWNLSQYYLIVLHNIDANMLCRLFDDRKYMYIYLPIHQEYGYLGKPKICLYFLHQLVNTCDLHLVNSLQYHVVNSACILCHFKQEISPVEDR